MAPPHPRVKTAGKVAAVIGVVFTLLAAVGVVVPNDAQNVVTVLAVDIAAAVPVIAGYLKTV